MLLTNNIKNQVELMAVVTSREERTSSQQFGENASYGPNVDSLRIKLATVSRVNPCSQVRT